MTKPKPLPSIAVPPEKPCKVSVQRRLDEVQEKLLTATNVLLHSIAYGEKMTAGGVFLLNELRDNFPAAVWHVLEAAGIHGAVFGYTNIATTAHGSFFAVSIDAPIDGGYALFSIIVAIAAGRDTQAIIVHGANKFVAEVLNSAQIDAKLEQVPYFFSVHKARRGSYALTYVRVPAEYETPHVLGMFTIYQPSNPDF
jgi:hypothetical protein